MQRANAVPPGVAAAHAGTEQQRTQNRNARTRRRYNRGLRFCWRTSSAARCNSDVLICLESVGLADHTIAKTNAYDPGDRFPQNIKPLLGKGCIIDAWPLVEHHRQGHVGAMPLCLPHTTRGISSKMVQITAPAFRAGQDARHGNQARVGDQTRRLRPAGERYREWSACCASHVPARIRCTGGA